MHMRPGAIAAGLLLVGLGVAMFLDTTEVFRVNVGRLIAPMVLIAIGAGIVLDGRGVACGRRIDESGGGVRVRRRRGSIGGIWLIGLGCWMLVSQTHLFGLSYNTSWPLIIILAGVMIVLRGWR
jgi:hypothetical protein